MDTTKIKTAETLQDLLDALREFEAAHIDAVGYENRETERALDWGGVCLADLPTFGGEHPGDTSHGIWSWDENSLLWGSGPFSDWSIEPREAEET